MCDVLSEFDSIENLDISYCEIKSIEHLKKLKNVKTLTLIGNPVPRTDWNLLRNELKNTEIVFE